MTEANKVTTNEAGRLFDHIYKNADMSGDIQEVRRYLKASPPQ